MARPNPHFPYEIYLPMKHHVSKDNEICLATVEPFSEAKSKISRTENKTMVTR